MVQALESPLEFPKSPDEPVVAQGEWVWGECQFACVLILQPEPDPKDGSVTNPRGAFGVGIPHIGNDPKDPARQIWRLALNRLPGTQPLVAGPAHGAALAVGLVGAEPRAIVWTADLKLE
jgi:hypothetical protein